MPLSWRWLYNLQTQTFLSEVEWRKENYKLKAMKRGKFDTLRSYDELVENANWQRQVREYLEKQNKNRSEGHDDLLPSVLRESAGVFIDSSN